VNLKCFVNQAVQSKVQTSAHQGAGVEASDRRGSAQEQVFGAIGADHSRAPCVIDVSVTARAHARRAVLARLAL